MSDIKTQKATPAALSDPAILMATWFGSGLLPKAPGTWGSLAALPFGWALHAMAGVTGLVLASIVVFALGVWASNRYLASFGGEDPAPVVIDEVAGMWLTLIPAAYFVPFAPDVVTYLVAFGLFRLADIFKPWPASWADRTIKGGLGVMTDDVIAAVFSAAGLAIFLVFLGN